MLSLGRNGRHGRSKITAGMQKSILEHTTTEQEEYTGSHEVRIYCICVLAFT
jgi:hypothetical protein